MKKSFEQPNSDFAIIGKLFVLKCKITMDWVNFVFAIFG